MANTPYKSTVEFRSMVSKDHEVRVKPITRKMLSCCNDKVYTVSAMESRPLGHYKNAQKSGLINFRSGLLSHNSKPTLRYSQGIILFPTKPPTLRHS